MAQIVIQPSVAFAWAFHMDFLNLVGQMLLFRSPAALFSRCPFVVSGTGYMEQFASCFNGKSLLLVTLFNGPISMTLSYF